MLVWVCASLVHLSITHLFQTIHSQQNVCNVFTAAWHSQYIALTVSQTFNDVKICLGPYKSRNKFIRVACTGKKVTEWNIQHNAIQQWQVMLLPTDPCKPVILRHGHFFTGHHFMFLILSKSLLTARTVSQNMTGELIGSKQLVYVLLGIAVIGYHEC